MTKNCIPFDINIDIKSYNKDIVDYTISTSSIIDDLADLFINILSDTDILNIRHKYLYKNCNTHQKYIQILTHNKEKKQFILWIKREGPQIKDMDMKNMTFSMVKDIYKITLKYNNEKDISNILNYMFILKVDESLLESYIKINLNHNKKCNLQLANIVIINNNLIKTILKKTDNFTNINKNTSDQNKMNDMIGKLIETM